MEHKIQSDATAFQFGKKENMELIRLNRDGSLVIWPLRFFTEEQLRAELDRRKTDGEVNPHAL